MLARLGEHIAWDKLTAEQVQVGVTEAKRAGAEATDFIRSGFRVQIGDFFRETGELAIQIPALARSTLEELRKKFSWIREKDGIERDTSPTDALTFNLVKILSPYEKQVDGIEYERRIALKLNLILGYQHGVWIVDHQDDPELAPLKALLCKVYIDLSGLVVVEGGTNGRRVFPCLVDDGKRWHVDFRRIAYGFRPHVRLAVSGK
ncbi:MAG: hypothetical protein HY470_00225 [Candidatus Ryanbacteria bacterium]|nr:hypothetical protein [Candidatus Ryanbacteria bacterium]